MTQVWHLARRTVLVAGMLVGLFIYPTSSSAAPLCAGGEDFIDDGDGICRNFFPGDNAKFYLFDAVAGFEHLLRITVEDVLFGPEDEEGETGGFGLRFRANSLSPDATFAGFPDVDCVAYGPGGMCIEYEAITDDGAPLEGTAGHPIEGTDYVGPVTWLIAWSQPIGTFPVPDILHEIGEESPQDDIYDEILEGVFFDPELGPFDFACDNPYYDECSFLTEFAALKVPGDPVRAARSDNFTKAILVQQRVPEPATLALFGLGLTGYVLNRRRRG